MSLHSVEIAIPILNEEATLATNVRRVGEYLAGLQAPWREASLVIADNGSADGSSVIAAELAREFPRVRYVRVAERGVGRALKAAWGTSSADIVGYMDLDLATDLRHLPEAFDALKQGADVVYGTRWHQDSVVRGRTLQRAAISRVFNLLLRMYLGATFSDGMCGFKFLRRAILPKLLANGAQSDGWFFATELLMVAQSCGYRLHELPVQWNDDSDSRVQVTRLTVEYLKAMRKLRARLDGMSPS
jgi:glycosyltransferase involved in cell wall biosynthesis